MPGAERLRDSAVLLQLLEKQKADGKIWSAICASPAVVLESQGWLKGMKATAHPAFVAKLTDQRWALPLISRSLKKLTATYGCPILQPVRDK